MRLISFSVCYFAILPIFNAVIAAPAPVVPDTPSITISPPQQEHVASPHSSQGTSASDPNRLGGSPWPGTGNKNRPSNQLLAPKQIPRTEPKAHRVSKQSPSPLGSKQHREQKHKPTRKGLLAKFQGMKIEEGKSKGSKEIPDQKMSNM